MAKATFQVPELHCDGCAEAIRDGLSDAPGVNRVDIDVATKRVAVDFDPDSTTDETVKNHIRDAGFDSKFTPERVEEQRAAPPAPQPSAKLWLWLLTAGVAALALAGYIGYELYPRFNLPRAEGAGLFLLAAGAGIASFFSPCAFPLLVTLLAREAGAPARGRGRGLAFATALSLGAATFLVLVGIGIAAGAGAAFAGVTFMSTAGLTIRAVTGAFLILLGLVQLGVLPNPLHAVEALARPLMRRQARYRRRSPVTGFALFGFGYLLAGFG